MLADEVLAGTGSDGKGTVETELKLGAQPGFELPDLTDVLPGVTVERLPTLDLDATYVDTADLRLVRWGGSLRHRTGEGAPRWTLKLPDIGTGGPALARRELDVHSSSPDVPAELVDLVTAWVRGAPLGPVAVIRTRRRRVALRGEGGVHLAEVDDDEVAVVDDGEVAARFRELEVELTSAGSSDLLTLVGDALRQDGAGRPDRTSKVVRALGPRALSPPAPAVPELSSSACVGDLVAAGIAAPVRSLLDHDPVVRLDDDVEGVHEARVATRRLRSNLRTFGSVLDPTWARGLRDELASLAAMLGGVRDADVLVGALGADLALLDEVDRPSGACLVEALRDERGQRLAVLLAAMRSPGYVDLLDRLVGASDDPPLTGRTARPAIELVPELVAPRWAALRKAVRRTGDDPSDDDLHRVRILAKRTRYAVEVAVPVVGAPAARLAGALARLQDVLGEIHDASVAEAWLRDAVPVVPHRQAMVAGQLIAHRQRRAARLRRRWRGAWEDCDRKGNLRWLS